MCRSLDPCPSISLSFTIKIISLRRCAVGTARVTKTNFGLSVPMSKYGGRESVLTV